MMISCDWPVLKSFPSGHRESLRFFRKKPPSSSDEDQREHYTHRPAKPLDISQHRETSTDGIGDKQGNAGAESRTTAGASGARVIGTAGWWGGIVFHGTVHYTLSCAGASAAKVKVSGKIVLEKRALA